MPDCKHLTCIICPQSCNITVTCAQDGSVTAVSGNKCARGDTYVRSEIVNPVRVVTSLVRVKGGSIAMCPVRTDRPVTKAMVREIALAVEKLTINAPVNLGDVVVQNILGSGANLVTTRPIPLKGNEGELGSSRADGHGP